MPAKANKGGASRGGSNLLWAAALTAMAPSAFAQTPGEDAPASSPGAAPPLDALAGDVSWNALIAACAQANAPLEEPAPEPPLPQQAYLDSSPHALVVHYGAPLEPATVTDVRAYEPWFAEVVRPAPTAELAMLVDAWVAEEAPEGVSAGAPLIPAIDIARGGALPPDWEDVLQNSSGGDAGEARLVPIADTEEPAAHAPEAPEVSAHAATEDAAHAAGAHADDAHAAASHADASHEEAGAHGADDFVEFAPDKIIHAPPVAARAPAPEPSPEVVAEAAQQGPLVPLDSVGVEGEGEIDEGDAGEDELTPIPSASGASQDGRRRPGQNADAPRAPAAVDPGAVAPPQGADLYGCEPALRRVREEGAVEALADPLAPCAPPVSDRWRLAENLGLVKPRWWDPYNQNTLKGDRPVPFLGDHWFFVGTAISDTIVEPRSFPIPMGVQTTDRPGSLDVFGDPTSLVLAQTFIASAAFIEGSTAFKPQDLEYRITLAANINYAEVEEKRILYVRPDQGTDRTDAFIGVQELFAEKHLRNVSDRFDFDSVRVGIQPFSSDFRGFLFQDNQLGVRFFGTRNNNRLQYNLAAFARLEKDTNSGLNDISDDIRQDYVFLANVYRQDTPVPGITSQLTAVYNLNREADEIEVDTNGFPVRPALIGDLRGREYDVGYVGYNADGRLGRLNLTASAYYAFGEDRNNTFSGEESVIRAYFVAAEPSVDFNWIRVRGSAAFASGDDNPEDDVEEGFDAIFENPQFAGADTSYWIRQTIPFIGGGRAIGLNGRNGLLPSLRSSKEQGQSNFINPGIALLGGGVDMDVLPELRISTSFNHLSFVHTESLQALRMDGSIDKDIGWDVSAALTYRPGFIQNFVFRLSGAALLPGDGFKDLFDNNQDDDFYYSVLFNGTLTY
jgi:hypothetical protein